MTTVATHPVAIKIDADIKERVKRLAEVRHRTPLNVKEATRKANEGLTGSGHDDELS
jgi:predicted transcriptional regulator